ncbi:MAG: site-specific integrase [Prevotellaceae bacterium]|jgi:site-specific recombinase XerD|nr:site-specific integrase [Prevotellaceae bacterium]
MASVKFYLDKRSVRKDGTYPLKLTVSHKNKAFHISLDIFIPEDCWVNNKIEGSVKNKKFLNSYIMSRYSGIENHLFTLKHQGKLACMDVTELKKRLERMSSIEPQEEEESVRGEKYLFRQHADKFIASRLAPKTRETYKSTLSKLSSFYNLDELTFGDIDYNWLEDFEVKMRATCRTNTRSIHMRNIRAIFRNATKRKLVSKDLYPFEDFSIKTEETLHRNLSLADLITIKNYPVEPHQEKYRDLFMLQFYLIGINTIDILHVEVITNGRLQYRRAKTGKLYDIKIHPEAMKIISKYTPGKKYLLNFLDNYKSYADFTHRYGRNLKQIGPVEWVKSKSKNGRGIKKKQYKSLFPFLSSYYARHTWATIAADLDIPEKTIRMALGHGRKTTTDIYINFDIKKVDEANNKIIRHLLSEERSRPASYVE